MTLDRPVTSVLPPPGASEGYCYLNTRDGWPELRLEALAGLVINGPDKALELASIPGNAQALGPELPASANPIAGMAGIAVDPDGNIYLSDPASDLIWIVDACDNSSQPLRCLGGTGSEPGRLSTPRGLAISRDRRLYVADAGNHRIQVVDLRALQLHAVWGQPDPLGEPKPGSESGRLNDPWDIAVDSAGYLYVADHGNHRVQKLTPNGQAVVEFWQTMATQSVVPQAPVSLSLSGSGAEERLLVVDGGRVLAYSLDGVFDEATTALWSAVTGVVCVRVARGLLYAGCVDGRLRVIGPDGVLRGDVAPFATPGAIAGLAVDCESKLLLRQVSGILLSLEPDVAYLRCGTFLTGPISAGPLGGAWQRVTVEAELPDGASVQLFTLSSNEFDGATGGAPPMPVACSGLAAAGSELPDPDEVVSLDTWRATPPGALDFLALSLTGKYFWVAGLLQGTGAATPRLGQVRVDFNHDSWMRHLPAVYRRSGENPGFAEQAMLLLQSAFDELEFKLDDMPRLFDPAGAPDDGLDTWLDWLGGWLALELQEDWPEEKRRGAVASAFAAHGRRGTVESLKELVELYADVPVHFSEPALSFSIWSLGETSTLGGDTMLASAHPDGAIVGTTSTLGQAHLITEADYGAPLFDDVSHRFCVSAYAVDMADATTVAKVRQVLDREKPAHTTYEFSTIDALMRVGVQAQIGIDSIIGDVAGNFEPGQNGALGYDSILPPLPDAPALIGKTTGLRRSLTIV